MLVYLVSVLVLTVKEKCTAVPVHATNACTGSECVALLITNLGT